MKLGIKNTLIIVITLLLGILIGFLANGRLTRLRIDNMRRDFIERGMERKIINAIKPTDEQMEKLKPIFDEYNEKRIILMEDHFADKKNLYDEFEEEISQYLSDEQIQRYEHLKKNMRNEMPGRVGKGKNDNPGRGNAKGRRYHGGKN